MSEFLDNRKAKQEKLKEVVESVHRGEDIQQVKRDFASLLSNVSAEEISELEIGLIQEGYSPTDIQALCEVHVAAFESSLKKQKHHEQIPGHPVHTFIAENKAADELLKELNDSLKNRTIRKTMVAEVVETVVSRLSEIETHFQRKENQLFPLLEAAGFDGPTKVMWGKHDEIRDILKKLKKAIEQKDAKEIIKEGKKLIDKMKKMIFMEEKILYPNALRKLSEEDWVRIKEGEAEIGYAWIKPGNLWDANIARTKSVGKAASGDSGQTATGTKAGESASVGAAATTSVGGPAERDGTDESPGDTAAGAPGAAGQKPTGSVEGGPESIPLDMGYLSGRQINLLLKNLPVDITFVDENDKVRYYSQGKERVFPRSPAIIGRSVQNCHPPKSMHIVEKILDSFKKREKEEAQFWLTMNDRFILIQYFALYDEEGSYRGVIEVSQDATEIRSLEGEKRLLDW